MDIFWNSTFFAIYSVESFLTVPIIIPTNDLLDNIAWVTGVFVFVAPVGRNFHDLLFVLMHHESFADRMFYLTSNWLIQLLSRNFESGQIWPLDLYYSDFVIGLFLDAISFISVPSEDRAQRTSSDESKFDFWDDWNNDQMQLSWNISNFTIWISKFHPDHNDYWNKANERKWQDSYYERQNHRWKSFCQFYFFWSGCVGFLKKQR